MHLTHKVQLVPTRAQQLYFCRACGVSRFAYNWALSEWTKQYQLGLNPSEGTLRKQLNSTKVTQFPWMLEVTKNAPQYAIKNLGIAFSKFFKKQAKYPKFKKKGIRDSFRADNGPRDSDASAVKVQGRTVVLPRIGKVKMKEDLRFDGRILSCVISRTADKWFASFTVELDHKPPVRENQATVGVDLGIKSLATLSDGTVFENPKALRSRLKKLKRLSRSLARKQKGSANRYKAKMKLARLHYRIACIRKDSLHKLTTHIVKNYTKVGIEDLNVRGMLKNRKLSRAVADMGLYEFKRQLEYKAKLYGSEIVVASRWYPSSKTCSDCGCVKDALALSERSWQCKQCGAIHDRDLNAAKNLKLMAESTSVTACGEDVRHSSNIVQTSLKQEAIIL